MGPCKIPKQIVAIGEDFHSQVGDGKVRSTLYKVHWEGYDKKDRCANIILKDRTLQFG